MNETQLTKESIRDILQKSFLGGSFMHFDSVAAELFQFFRNAMEREKEMASVCGADMASSFQNELNAKNAVLKSIMKTEWHPDCDMVNVEIPFEMRLRAQQILERYP